MTVLPRWLLPRLAYCVLLCASAALAQEDAARQQRIRFFETRIRPLLAERCYECHGPQKQESDLQLDTLEGIRRGGAAGMAVVPGSPEQSLLLTAVGYQDADLRMPPDGRLSGQQVADLRHWIQSGAPHPDSSGAARLPERALDLEAARQFWAFQPPRKVRLPAVRGADWPATAIDNFVLAGLEARELRPAPPADRRTLIRRVTLNLTGLPPTPEEVTAFFQDTAPDAYPRLVDRLLGSVHYGERWGRHWLDVARYADSNGLDENVAHGNAWRYRDYVIASFNQDTPYDRFVTEQLAGDLLPPAEDERTRHDRLIATGFLSLGPKVLAEGDEEKMVMDIVDEQIDTVGRTFLALTMGCARCHDHKFDPLRAEDYYALAGVFKSTRTMESTKRIARWHENSIATGRQLAGQEAHAGRVTEQKEVIQRVIDQANAALLAEAGAGGELPKDAEARYPAEIREQLERLRGELAELEAAAPELPTAMGVADGEVVDVPIHVRGSHLTLGQSVSRGVPAVLAFDGQPTFDAAGSGRLELAHWLVRPEHALTARVIVNRIWRWHFGQGLVASVDNFGNLGAQPSNRELLDWLAVEFVQSGWSIKRLHRLILLSSSYRMSSDFDAANARIDPENRFQWRHSIRRLEAEVVRDSLLAAGGLLERSMGGSLLHVANREFIFNHTSKDETRYDSRRRSIYLPVIRNHLYDVFQLFDYTDASVPNGDRPSSTVAPQALFMMNSELVAEVSRALAERLLVEETADRARVERLYETALGRPPMEDELGRALGFIDRIAAGLTAEQDSEDRRLAWGALCQVILASNEFVHTR